MMELGHLRLRDMKLTPTEREDDAPSNFEPPEYSYGLRLRLGEEELKKLDIGLPGVGQKFRVIASGTVKSVSQDQSEDHERQNVEIQLEQLLLVPAGVPSIQDQANPVEAALRKLVGGAVA